MRVLAITIFALFVLLGPSLSGWGELRAQEVQRIGVVDVQRILRESKALNQLSKRVEEIRAQHQAVLNAGEREIREADRSLALERPEIEPLIYANRRKALELRATTLQRDHQDKMRAIDTIYRQGLAQIQHQLSLIIQEISEERDLDFVLGRATVLIVAAEAEITDDALKRLNERLPSVLLPGLAED